jgi:hypothetical protein
MRADCPRFNILSMTHSSLSRVIVFVPALLWACAQQVDDFPEQLEGDDAQAVGKAGAVATGGSAFSEQGPSAIGGSANVVQAGGTSSGGTRTYTPSGGQTGKAGASSGGSAPLPASEEGGAAAEEGGAAGATAGSGGGDTGGSAGHAGSAGGGGTAGTGASAGSSSGGSVSVGACSGVAKWSAGTYAAGARVQNGVNLYQCKPHPYSGWCGLEAYAPGSGWAWTDAWAIVGPC